MGPNPIDKLELPLDYVETDEAVQKALDIFVNQGCR
jgi:hypothetical protein